MLNFPISYVGSFMFYSTQLKTILGRKIIFLFLLRCFSSVIPYLVHGKM